MHGLSLREMKKIGFAEIFKQGLLGMLYGLLFGVFAFLISIPLAMVACGWSSSCTL